LPTAGSVASRLILASVTWHDAVDRPHCQTGHRLTRHRPGRARRHGAFDQNLRRGHYDIALDTVPATRLAAAFG
jgi:hypothetical protein